MFSRRSLLLSPLALEAAFLEPSWASDFINSAGRKVQLPDSIKRDLSAGPPAEALLDSLAPEKLVRLVGPWTDIQKLLDIEAIRALHADLIVDYGAVDEHYTAFANKVQTETGIPYLLLDGRLAQSAGGRAALRIDRAQKRPRPGYCQDDQPRPAKIGTLHVEARLGSASPSITHAGVMVCERFVRDQALKRKSFWPADAMWFRPARTRFP